MPAVDYVAQAKESLLARKAELRREMDRLDRALAALGEGMPNVMVLQPAKPRRQRTVHGPTVRSAVMKMLESDPTRTWQVSEIIDSLRNRPDVPQVADLGNAVRTVVSEGAKAGELERVDTGQYRLRRDAAQPTTGLTSDLSLTLGGVSPDQFPPSPQRFSGSKS